MMDYIDMALRAGALGILALLVRWGLAAGRAQADAYLKAMAMRDELYQRALAKRDDVVQQVSERCHANQDRSTDAVVELTGAMAGVTESVRATGAVLGEVRVLLIKANGKKGG